MVEINEEKIDIQRMKKIFDIFEPDENGKKIKKLQVINEKLVIDYEGGEK